LNVTFLEGDAPKGTSSEKDSKRKEPRGSREKKSRAYTRKKKDAREINFHPCPRKKKGERLSRLGGDQIQMSNYDSSPPSRGRKRNVLFALGGETPVRLKRKR